jgi:hypothetical protein
LSPMGSSESNARRVWGSSTYRTATGEKVTVL